MTEFATRCVHAGLTPDPSYGSVIPAIHASSTYVQPAPGEYVGDFDYSRSANPTRAALETALGELEGGLASAFSSGMAAEHALITAVGPGHMVIPNDLYGGTYRLVDKVLSRFGIEYSMVDQRDLDAVAAAVRDDTQHHLGGDADESDAQRDRPRWDSGAEAGGVGGRGQHVRHARCTSGRSSCGADAVVHSTTKYLGGHSDVVGGAAIVRDPALHEKVRFVQNAVGAVPGPFDCFLVHRGLRTLHLRVAAHDANGLRCRRGSKEQAGVEDVRWPGFGGMVSFRHPDAIRIASSTSVFSLAESLGGVESLIEVPQAMTHQSVEDSSAAVPADLVRLSCGIEASVDLIADLAQALTP